MDEFLLRKYQNWRFEDFQHELKEIKKRLESKTDGFQSHFQEINRTAVQEKAAKEFSEIMSVLRYREKQTQSDQTNGKIEKK